MKHERDTAEYLKSIKLSTEAKARMRDDLSSYADFHTVTITEEPRSIAYIQQRTVWSYLFGQGRSTTMYAQATLLIALMVAGGGTVTAASGALPGDALYPVKIHVNETVRSALAVGANAQARLEAELLMERVDEAEQLAAEGELEGETAAYVESQIEAQTLAVAEANAEADADVALAIDTEVAAEVGERLTTLAMAGVDLGTETTARIATAANAKMGFAADTGAAMMMSTELAGEIDLDTRINAADDRGDGLSAVVTAAVELDAAVRADLMAKIDAAAKAVADARTHAAAEAEAEAEASVNTADELLGEVESALSLLGEVTIDAETGAIIDIDVYDAAELESRSSIRSVFEL